MTTSLIIVTGGQSGVDRAALDAAIALGIGYAGWCPKGGWAEDFPDPPGLPARYPHLRETPLADPAQRTDWNVRDSDATLIVVDAGGIAVSRGTEFAENVAQRYDKPLLVVDVNDPAAAERVMTWLAELRARHPGAAPFRLAIGGPRESEAVGIYERARVFLAEMLAS